MWREILLELRERKSDVVKIKENDKDRILRNAGNVLTKQSSSIVLLIGQLRKLLQDNRLAYMMGSAGAGGPGCSTGMTEFEMDQIDGSAHEIFLKCTELIKSFSNNFSKVKMSVSAQEHFSLVAVGLNDYLKQTVSIHSEMRAVRIKKQVQLKNLSKLEINSRESRLQEINPRKPPTDLDIQEKAITAAALNKSGGWESSDDDEELSPSEVQQMEMENDMLVEQLTSLNNQVDQVTSKVVKISELQEIFSEKVLQQTADIEHVHAQAVSTTENIKEGNEAVRQAIQNQASYRVIILFILLVFSFSLLFLDWYNE